MNQLQAEVNEYLGMVLMLLFISIAESQPKITGSI